MGAMAPAPVVVAPAANVVVAPAANVAVTTTTTATTKGGPFAENEDVESLFRGNWFAAKIIKSYGNGKYKVKYLKSKTFGTVTENKIRRKHAVVRKTVVTRTATSTAAGINADVNKAAKEVNKKREFGRKGHKFRFEPGWRRHRLFFVWLKKEEEDKNSHTKNGDAYGCPTSYATKVQSCHIHDHQNCEWQEDCDKNHEENSDRRCSSGTTTKVQRRCSCRMRCRTADHHRGP